jgi:hypothetical protein
MPMFSMQQSVLCHISVWAENCKSCFASFLPFIICVYIYISFYYLCPLWYIHTCNKATAMTYIFGIYSS